MKTNQTTCDPERIELFLEQKLSDEEQSAFESHLSACGNCRQRLETAAASEDVSFEICASLKDNELRDEQLPPDGPASDDPDLTGEEAFSSQATILKLLAPTDDDRMIGRWGAYEVVGVVGTGGMGVVLKAFDAALNRYVAIKILAPHLGSSGAAIRRFSREGKAAAAVVHDNVIEIHGVSEAAGLPYLVMPYVRGPSLQRRLDDEGPLAVVEILRVAMQAAAGLAAAHAQGLVHRDVKPANILLADGIERVKLTDFGLARAADDASLTKTGIIAGTPQYMSPEQARGEPVDPRSDLFSLGSVLYAMCTGRAPFRAETSYGVLRRITDEEPRPIREINPDIPDWLCAIVGKLIAKRPEDRFQSAHEVAALLEQCLAHVQQPTVVPLPTTNSPLLPGEGKGERAADVHKSRPFSGWSRRKRILASAIGLLFVGSLGLAFGIIIHLKKDNKTTTIEVPEGSTAHVDAQGAVTLELASSAAVTKMQPDLGTNERKSRVPISEPALLRATRLIETNIENNRVSIKGWAQQGARLSFYAGERKNGWGCVFPKATGFTATLEIAATEMNCSVLPDTGDPVLTLIGAKHIGSVVLSNGQFIFRVRVPHKERDGSETARIGQWTTKSGDAIDIGVTLTPPQSDVKTEAEPASAAGGSPVIERVTVDPNRAVIEGRASKNDKIVFVFGDKEAMSQTFPSSVHFKCTVEEGEVDGRWGTVARVTDVEGKELPDMPAQILPVNEPVFVQPSSPAMTYVNGPLHFRKSAARMPDGTAIVADYWTQYVQRVPFGVNVVPAGRKSEEDHTGVTVSGRVLTEPGGTGVAGVKVGLYDRVGPNFLLQYAVTAADGSYAFRDVPRNDSPPPKSSLGPDRYYEAWIEAAPDRPPGVWSEGVSLSVEQQDVHAHDLYLKFPQSISGTVRDADTGKPIAGARVDFSSNEGRSGPLMLAKRKVTDAEGRYRLYLRPREVTVSCGGTPDRYNRDDVHGKRTLVAEPQQETTVDFFCTSGAPLTGRVVNPDGTPAKDARVLVSVNWPVRVTPNGAGFGGTVAGGRGGAASTRRRGGRDGPSAGGGPDRSLPRTINMNLSFDATTDGEGRFAGYMRQPDLYRGEYERNIGPERRTLQTALPLSIKARAWVPDRSLGGVGQAEMPVGEPLANPLIVKLEKTGAAVVRVLLQDGRPVPDAEIRVEGAVPPGRPAEYLGDGRYRVAGLIAGTNYRLRAFGRKLPTRTETGPLEIKSGQTTDAGELRLEWEEGLAGDAQPRFRIENGVPVTLAFSPDGAMLASISTPAASNKWDVDEANLIDVATGKVLETGHIPARCMAFFPKSDKLALGYSDGTMVLTNEKKLTTWKRFVVSSSGAHAYALAVSPNGAMIACGAGDGTTGSFTVGCWDVASGRKMHTLGDKGMPTIALAFSPDNKLLVTVDSFGLCKAWDLESEKVLGSFQIVHDNNRFAGDHIDSLSISFCPDGKTAAIAVHYYHGARPGHFTGGRNNGEKRDQSPPEAEPVQFWDPRGGKPPVVVSLPDEIKPKLDPDASEDEPMKGPGRTVLSPDCKTAATVLYSGWVAVWDISSRRVLQVFPASNWEGTQSQFKGLAFSPDGRLLATGNSQGVVEVWEIGTAARDAEKNESPAAALRGQSKTSGNQKPEAPVERPKPVGVSLEWIELDCTKCPELAKCFQPDEGRAGVADRADPVFADLEAKAAKQVLVHDVEWIAPGAKVKHTTRVNETNFDLELSLSLRSSGSYTIIMNASRSEGTPLCIQHDRVPSWQIHDIRRHRNSVVRFSNGRARNLLPSTGLNRPYGIAVTADVPEPSSLMLLSTGAVAPLCRSMPG